MQFETYLIITGYIFAICAALYSAAKYKLFPFYLVAFGLALMFQASQVASFVDTSEAFNRSATEGVSYYSALPLFFKISLHAGQAGIFIVGLGILLVTKPLTSYRSGRASRSAG